MNGIGGDLVCGQDLNRAIAKIDKIHSIIQTQEKVTERIMIFLDSPLSIGLSDDHRKELTMIITAI